MHPQMECEIGFTYVGVGFEKALNKAWSRVWRRAPSLSPTTSVPAIFKMMRTPEIGFRARKLNTMTATQTY